MRQTVLVIIVILMVVIFCEANSTGDNCHIASGGGDVHDKEVGAPSLIQRK